MTKAATKNTADRKRAIRRRLRAVGKKLALVPDWHAEKVRLLQEGRDEGILLREMGEDLGISESAVLKALKRDESHT